MNRAFEDFRDGHLYDFLQIKIAVCRADFAFNVLVIATAMLYHTT
jgi:hypothetical protein